MADYSFKLPDLGEGIVESEIVEWYVATGDMVEQEQHIADVMTDKALVEVTAPVSGVVLQLGCAAGNILPVGQELIRFKIEQNDGAEEVAEKTSTKEVETEKTVPTPTAKETVLPAINHDKPKTSPSIRRQAREQGIDLALVAPTGLKGRITQEDLAHYLLQQTPPVTEATPPTNTYPLKGLRRVIAHKMQQSKRHIPHYSYIEEVDITELEHLRQHLNSADPTTANTSSEQRPKLTLLPFILQALGNTLPDFPHCNAHYQEEQETVTEFPYFHAGIATMTPQGLMVPVIKYCERLTLWQRAAEITRLSEGANQQQLSADDMQGSTLTVTSLGALGGIATTPIINAPEVSVIGVNKMQERVVVHNGEMVIRKMMNISASFDHRIVDGADGARLVQAIKRQLEHPATLFL